MTDRTADAETLCGDSDCTTCATGTGTCADGFARFVDYINGKEVGTDE